MRKKTLLEKNIPSLKQYFSKHKLGIFLYFLLYFVATILDVAVTLLSANMLEQVTIERYKKAIILLSIGFAIKIVQSVFYYLANLVYCKYSVKIMADINLDLSRQAFKLNSKTFSDSSTGVFVQRIVSDPERVVDSCTCIVEILTDIFTSLVLIGYIAFLNVWISVLVVVSVAICSFIEVKRAKKRRKNRHDMREKNDAVNSITTEIVRSEKDIKSLGMEGRLSEISGEKYGAYRKSYKRFQIVDSSFSATRNILLKVAVFLILIFGIKFLDKGAITLASFILIKSNSESLNGLIKGFGQLFNMIADVRVCTDRMFSLFDENQFVTEHFGTVHLDNVTGSVVFNEVSFCYDEYDYKSVKKKVGRRKKWIIEKTLKNQKTVFENLSFELVPNTTVAFVGKSGSGKTTILNLMSKMLESTSGEVLIDGIDIKDLDKDTIRRTISLVNQFPYIFDMTIKDNLLLAKSNATDEELNDAIKKSYLDEFISSLSDGINTKVGESGIKLSGGQKQRLAIARALLRKSPIILFDESTSSLDNFAQGEVKKSIDLLKGQSTIVIVAHRLSTIKNVDKIFFLNEGKIADTGTFDELFEKNQDFKAMFLAENV